MKILFHDTGGLFKGFDRLYQQFCRYAQKLGKENKQASDAMTIWLGCGKF